MNESVYYSIDEIQRALTEDRQISFQYCEWTVEKELRLKKNGERYRVSPWGLVWAEGRIIIWSPVMRSVAE